MARALLCFVFSSLWMGVTFCIVTQAIARTTDPFNLPKMYFEQDDTRLGNIILKYAALHTELSEIDTLLAEAEAGATDYMAVAGDIEQQLQRIQSYVVKTDMRLEKYFQKRYGTDEAVVKDDHSIVRTKDNSIFRRAEIFARSLQQQTQIALLATEILNKHAAAQDWDSLNALIGTKSNSHLLFLQAEIIGYELNSTFVATWTPEYHLLGAMKQGNIISLEIIEFIKSFNNGGLHSLEKTLMHMKMAQAQSEYALMKSNEITDLLERELNDFFNKNSQETDVFIKAYRKAIAVELQVSKIMGTYIALCDTMVERQLSDQLFEERLLELDAQLTPLIEERANLRLTRPAKAQALLKQLSKA